MAGVELEYNAAVACMLAAEDCAAKFHKAFADIAARHSAVAGPMADTELDIEPDAAQAPAVVVWAVPQAVERSI